MKVLRNNINTDKLKKVLTESYGFSIDQISVGSRGFDGETFNLYQTNGEVLFVKCMKKGEFSQRSLHMQISFFLDCKNSNLNCIISMVPSKNGDYFSYYGDFLVVVYEFIDGINTFEYSIDWFINTMYNIHSAPIGDNYIYDDFVILHKDEDLHNMIKKLEISGYTGVFDFISQYQSKRIQILHSLKDLSYLMQSRYINSKQYKSNKSQRVVTHGDMACNIMKSINSYYVIDWDGIQVSLVERDLRFVPSLTEAILLYQKYNPSYICDKDAIKFFSYKRYIDDLFDYGELLLNEYNPELYQDMVHEVSGWLSDAIDKADSLNGNGILFYR